MKKKNTILQQNPPELDKIAAIRKKLANTDRDDHLLIVDEMESKVKASIIKLSLLDHEGIAHLRNLAREAIRSVNQQLIEEPAKNLTPEAAVSYALHHAKLHNKKALWSEFLSFFSNAEQDLKEINQDLDFQLAPDEEESAGD